MLVLRVSSAAGFTLARFPVLLLPKRIFWHPALESGFLVTEFLVIVRNGGRVMRDGEWCAMREMLSIEKVSGQGTPSPLPTYFFNRQSVTYYTIPNMLPLNP